MSGNTAASWPSFAVHPECRGKRLENWPPNTWPCAATRDAWQRDAASSRVATLLRNPRAMTEPMGAEELPQAPLETTTAQRPSNPII